MESAMQKKSSANPNIVCDPNGPQPEHNRMLERNNIPPEAIENCDAETEAGRSRGGDPAKKKTGEF
jgi:hypothetical protein